MVYTLDDLEVYNLAEEYSNLIWEIVEKWNSFAKFGLGRQITDAADSISANIAEGYGRYFLKENINFCFYARGSLLETKSWLRKGVTRNLIEKEKHELLLLQLETIHKKLNGYIKSLKINLQKQNATPNKQVNQ
ncbi:MAG TPA: four helix bundle protein [Chitinophagaceae bacterium]|nr:four helix bundle protein [Chitinophagaceae bacterium]